MRRVEVIFGKGISAPRIIDGRAYARACSLSKGLHINMYSRSAVLEMSWNRRLELAVDGLVLLFQASARGHVHPGLVVTEYPGDLLGC